MSPGGLGGARFAAAYQHELTSDRVRDAGRWIASDESGWDGEQLIAREDRFMTIGSVAIDDERAAEVLFELRARARISQAGELKFRHITRRPRRLHALADMMSDPEFLGERASVYFVDKTYMAASKIVDLLVEEVFHDAGRNLYEGGMNLAAARALTLEAPIHLGPELHLRMLQTIVNFASARNVGGAMVTADALMECLRECRDACPPGWSRTTLDYALLARHHAASLLQTSSVELKALEPLIPSLASHVGSLVQRHGTVRILADEHIELDDAKLDFIARVSPFGLNVTRTGWDRSPGSATVYRGASAAHPSIQVADLVAGAGLAVARAEVDPERPVPAALREAVLAAMDRTSLLPHDHTDRLVVA